MTVIGPTSELKIWLAIARAFSYPQARVWLPFSPLSVAARTPPHVAVIRTFSVLLRFFQVGSVSFSLYLFFSFFSLVPLLPVGVFMPLICTLVYEVSHFSCG